MLPETKQQEKLKTFLKKSPYHYEVTTLYRDYVVIKFSIGDSLSFTERKAKKYEEYENRLDKKYGLYKQKDDQ